MYASSCTAGRGGILSNTLRFFARDDVVSLAKSGVATPDHVIRMKARPLLLEIEDTRKNASELAKFIETYAENYQAYFERCAKSGHTAKKMLSPLPKLIWAKGVLKASETAGTGAFNFEGKMVDAPVLSRAKSIIEREV